jgi:sulfate transport system substrate-binding protein
MRTRFTRTLQAVAVTAIAGMALLAAGCGGGSGDETAAAAGGDATTASGTGDATTASGGAAKLNLVAYSTPKEAYAKVIPAFQKTPAGAGVTFNESYGASGEQSRAVEAGLPADVVEFSLETDMTRLVDAGLVASDWNAGPQKGMVTDSVVVFAVRKGNPKGIHTWDDLVKPGIEVITPNPFSSGGARWNLMAGYGAQIKLGKTPEQAEAYLKSLLEHTVVQDKSARDALQTFVGGKGDVMLAYENEAILAQHEGQDLDYVVPDQTILIENPIAVTTSAPPAAKAFVDFALTPDAQKLYAETGYRPVLPDVLSQFDFPQPPQLFTIADLGGWSEVAEKFFDRDNGIVALIEKGLGVSTAQS